MRKTLLALAVLSPTLALGQATISAGFQINLPAVLPQLVVIQPGVQVVPQVQEEVFYVDNHYWCRRGDAWYRSPDHRHGWVVVERRVVPARLVELPEGHYRNWMPPGQAKKAYKRGHGGGGHGHGHGNGHGKH
ncbi:MAG: hypothetical protein QM767_29885 [Anaeromyxobacter sp.]